MDKPKQIEMNEPNESTKSKLLKDILKEGLFDIIGFDRGVLRTQLDIIRQPEKVIKAYHQNDSTYTRPVAFALISGSVYLLLANYLINWDAIAEFVMDLFKTKLGGNNLAPVKINEFRKSLDLIFDIFLRKYFVIIILATAFLRAGVFTRITNGATFANMLVIMLYRHAGGIFIQSAGLLCIIYPNSFTLLSWILITTMAEQFAFRNYINETLGQGTKKPFQKRILIVILAIIIISLLIGLIGEFIESL